ncbi:MAG: Holliday junction resolvase RuvX, partial [Planctomycetota bacterium]
MTTTRSGGLTPGVTSRPESMRYLGVDLGDRRTGLAVGDDITSLASPEGVLEIPITRENELIEALIATVRDQDVDGVVLGLPLNMDDTEGPRAKLARRFGA